MATEYQTRYVLLKKKADGISDAWWAGHNQLTFFYLNAKPYFSMTEAELDRLKYGLDDYSVVPVEGRV